MYKPCNGIHLPTSTGEFAGFLKHHPYFPQAFWHTSAKKRRVQACLSATARFNALKHFSAAGWVAWRHRNLQRGNGFSGMGPLLCGKCWQKNKTTRSQLGTKHDIFFWKEIPTKKTCLCPTKCLRYISAPFFVFGFHPTFHQNVSGFRERRLVKMDREIFFFFRRSWKDLAGLSFEGRPTWSGFPYVSRSFPSVWGAQWPPGNHGVLMTLVDSPYLNHQFTVTSVGWSFIICRCRSSACRIEEFRLEIISWSDSLEAQLLNRR